MKLTTKQEKFAQNLFTGMKQSTAYREAGYACNSVATVNSNACRLAKNAYVLQYLDELKVEVKSDKIMDVTERKEVLSEIARGNLLDYQETGADGGYLNIGKESPNTRAISEITSRTEYDKDGTGAALVTKVKLHNPISAIAELNKMERIYEPAGATTINNQILNVAVVSEDSRRYTERIAQGERTD